MSSHNTNQTGQPRCVIDHIVLLMPDKELESPPSWLADNFSILEGGTHTGGGSRNRLIIFKDGTYIELLSWIDKSKSIFPAWNWRPEGSYIDFALTTLPPLDAETCWEEVQDDIEIEGSDLNIIFAKPKAGGRQQPDGTEITWKTSKPQFSEDTKGREMSEIAGPRLDVPFFCHDITERHLRVPHDDSSLTTHPCGAVGISNIDIVVPQAYYRDYLKLYTAVLGYAPRASGTHGEEIFDVGVPDAQQGSRATISIRPEEASNGYLNSSPQVGTRGVELYVPDLSGKKSLIGGVARTSVPVLNLVG